MAALAAHLRYLIIFWMEANHGQRRCYHWYFWLWFQSQWIDFSGGKKARNIPYFPWENRWFPIRIFFWTNPLTSHPPFTFPELDPIPLNQSAKESLQLLTETLGFGIPPSFNWLGTTKNKKLKSISPLNRHELALRKTRCCFSSSLVVVYSDLFHIYWYNTYNFFFTKTLLTTTDNHKKGADSPAIIVARALRVWELTASVSVWDINHFLLIRICSDMIISYNFFGPTQKLPNPLLLVIGSARRSFRHENSWKKQPWFGESRPTGWWFGTFFIFPYIGNNHPNWLIFFRGVQTTNQPILSHDFQLCRWPCWGPGFRLHHFSSQSEDRKLRLAPGGTAPPVSWLSPGWSWSHAESVDQASNLVVIR